MSPLSAYHMGNVYPERRSRVAAGGAVYRDRSRASARSFSGKKRFRLAMQVVLSENDSYAERCVAQIGLVHGFFVDND